MVSEIMRVSQNLMWGILPPAVPIRWNLYVCSKYLFKFSQSHLDLWQGQISQPNFSIISLCIMQLCEYVFPIAFPLHVPQNGIFGGFEGEDVKIMCSNPQKAWIRVCWCIACQNRFSGLSSTSVERFCVQRRKKFFKKLCGNLAIWGDVPLGRSWPNVACGEMVDVITCAIFRDCRLRGVGVVRAVRADVRMLRMLMWSLDACASVMDRIPPKIRPGPARPGHVRIGKNSLSVQRSLHDRLRLYKCT